jgi:hypothetical protein
MLSKNSFLYRWLWVCLPLAILVGTGFGFPSISGQQFEREI